MATLDKVKEHFKNAKLVKCLSDGEIVSLDLETAHVHYDDIWADNLISEAKIYISKTNTFAEIVEYKTKTNPLQKEVDNLKKRVAELESNPPLPAFEELGNIGGYWINSNSEIQGAVKDYPASDNINLFATKKQAEQSLAISQLSQLVYHANGKSHDFKVEFIIGFSNASDFGAIPKCTRRRMLLSFKTESLANRFLTKHKDLISQYYGLH